MQYVWEEVKMLFKLIKSCDLIGNARGAGHTVRHSNALNYHALSYHALEETHCAAQ